MSLVMRKPASSTSCICKNKALISAFDFTTQIVQSLYIQNPKFQAYPSSVVVLDLVRNLEDRFSHNAAHIIIITAIE